MTNLPDKYPPVPHQHPPNRSPATATRHAYLESRPSMRQIYAFHAPAAPEKSLTVRLRSLNRRNPPSQGSFIDSKAQMGLLFKPPRPAKPKTAQKCTKTHKNALSPALAKPLCNRPRRQSARKACTISTREARSAGSTDATTAAASSTRVTARHFRSLWAAR